MNLPLLDMDSSTRMVRGVGGANNKKVWLILLVLSTTLVMAFVNYYYLNESIPSSSSTPFSSLPQESWPVHLPALHLYPVEQELAAAEHVSDIVKRIKEMYRIRGSIGQELRLMESRRTHLTQEVSTLTGRVDSLKNELVRMQNEVDRTKTLLHQMELNLLDAGRKQAPLVMQPLKPMPLPKMTGSITPRNIPSCSMSSCFDYSRCPLSSGFQVFVYDLSSSTGWKRSNPSIRFLSLIELGLKHSPLITNDPTSACVFLVVLPVIKEDGNLKQYMKSVALGSFPHWNQMQDGMNHIILNPNEEEVSTVEPSIPMGRSILVQSTFHTFGFRPKFDVVLNSLVAMRNNVSTSVSLPPMSPARRKYLVTGKVYIIGSLPPTRSGQVQSYLKNLMSNSPGSTNESRAQFLFQFDQQKQKVDWIHVLFESTFNLIFTSGSTLLAQDSLSRQLVQTIETGTIPIIIGSERENLPFGEVIDWGRAVIFLPHERITELDLVVRSFTDADLVDMKRCGRMLYTRYFSSISSSVSSLLSLIRQKRLSIPAPSTPSEPAVLMFHPKRRPMKMFELQPADPEPLNGGAGAGAAGVNGESSLEPDENLGPVEPPFPSPSYQRNLSLVLAHSHDLWNDPSFHPFLSYPFTPFDPVLPSESKFVGSQFGFRPIGDGTGGSGKEFSQSLGGNFPKEQFTIVLLTYEREDVLIDSIQRMKGLPYLNKVLVVWNNPDKEPDVEMGWPNIGVPVQVVKESRNSLNNRFKPYDQIETEAVLSMDDDVHLRHDEIVFGFRVWRESRDRIVGFPGRFHAWDSVHSSWLYNSNYSCELSMVLTGASFFHKYYMYQYTYEMPEVIREAVDQFINCEDIAMNFLVSHITRKPPIKVTSRWTFSCPSCPVSLSEDDSHFQERHKCVNLFTEAYGHLPNLWTIITIGLISALYGTKTFHECLSWDFDSGFHKLHHQAIFNGLNLQGKCRRSFTRSWTNLLSEKLSL